MIEVKVIIGIKLMIIFLINGWYVLNIGINGSVILVVVVENVVKMIVILNVCFSMFLWSLGFDLVMNFEIEIGSFRFVMIIIKKIVGKIFM